jgi:hypothetical protein
MCLLEEIQRSEVRQPRRPLNWPSKPNLSPWVRRVYTLGYFPRCVMEIRLAGTITPVAQLGVHLKAAPVEQSEEKR